MNLLNHIRRQPLQVINYTELLFAFVAHLITIPIIGVLTGLICGCAVHYTIQIQRDGSKPATRQRAFWGTLVFKTGQLWIHQTSFLFMLQWSGKTLPFGWALDTWAWITTVFLFSIDVWALAVTSQEAEERAAAEAEQESIQRAAEREEADRRARAEQAERDQRERLDLARIQADAETRKAQAEAEARAQEVKAKAEAEAEAARIRAEANARKAEADAEARKVEAEERMRKAEVEVEERKRRAEERKQKAEADAAEKQRLLEEKRRREEAEAEAARQQAEAQPEASAEGKRSPEVWRQLIAETETALQKELNRKPTRKEVASRLGTTDRTIRTYANATAE